MVTRRKCSASRFICRWRSSSAPYIFKVVRPCKFSRKWSPSAAYCPQYLPRRRFANFCTATMDTGISGTHTISTTAARTLTVHSTANSVTGDSML